MCGIALNYNLLGQPVNIDIMQQFDEQRHRGTQGFGLFDGQEMNMIKHSKEDGIIKWLDRYPSNMIMFHHRYPTSTVNVKRAAHPFSTKDFFGDTQYVLVHNGGIRNAKTLFTEHVKNHDIDYQSVLEDETFNDSEALLWDFALVMEGKQKYMRAYGPMAFICMKIVKGKIERLYFGRNSNPLNLFRNETSFKLSSEGEGEAIESQMLYNYNYKKNRLSKRKFEIPSYIPYHHDDEYSHDGYYGNSRAGAPSNEGKFPGSNGVSGYTPGSYADRSSRYSHNTERQSACAQYPTIFDCDCENVGWERCEYHGAPYLFDDNDDPTQPVLSHDGLDYLRDEADARSSDDSAAYATWLQDHKQPKPGEPGDWIPPEVRAKFARLLGRGNKGANKAKGGEKPADYIYDAERKLMLPAGTSKAPQRAKHVGETIPTAVIKDITKTGDSLADAMKRNEDRKSAEEQFLIQSQTAPSKGEVETEYMAYLASVHGHFEQAYWQLEDDYMKAEDMPDTKENIRHRYLIEKVMEYLSSDPEYVSPESVSSVWKEVWTNKRQTALA